MAYNTTVKKGLPNYFQHKVIYQSLLLASVAKAVLNWSAVVQLEWESRLNFEPGCQLINNILSSITLNEV